MPGLSSDERQTLEAGLERLTQAVQQEKKGCREEALGQYCQGLKLLLPLKASPRCTGQFRDVLRQKCSQFLNQVRQLATLVRHRGNDVRTSATGDDVTTGVGQSESTSDSSPHPRDVRPSVTGEDVTTGAAHAESTAKSVTCPCDVRTSVTEDDVTTGVDHSASAPFPRDVRPSVTGEDVTTGAGHSESTIDRAPFSEKQGTEDIRTVNKEVAHENVTDDPSDEACPGQAETLVDAAEDAGAQAQAEGEDVLLRQVEEVEALAMQYFTEKELQGIRQQLEDDAEERSGRQKMVQKVLDDILHSSFEREFDDSWATAPGVGLEDLDVFVRERLILPLMFPKVFSNMCRFMRHLLLYGHPGDGILPALRHLHKKWATYRLYMVSAHSLVDVVLGGVKSSDLVKAMFQRCFDSAPSALCVTDMEVLAQSRESMEEDVRRLKTEFLTHLHALDQQQDIVFFVGVTSRPWLIDSAVRRRFCVYRKFCSRPTAEQRMAVLKSALQGVPCSFDRQGLERIAERTAEFSREDMVVLAGEALAMLKIRVQNARFFKPVAQPTPTPPVSHPVNDDGNEDETGADGDDDNGHSVNNDDNDTDDDDEDDGNDNDDDDYDDGDDDERNLHQEDVQQRESNYAEEEEEGGDWIPETCAGEERSPAEPNSDPNRDDGLDDPNDHQATGTVDGANERSSLRDVSNDTRSHEDLRNDQGDTNTPTTSSAKRIPAAPSSPPLFMYVPCDASDDGAVAMTWCDVPPGQLLEPELTCHDVLLAIPHACEQLDEYDSWRMMEWHDLHGVIE